MKMQLIDAVTTFIIGLIAFVLTGIPFICAVVLFFYGTGAFLEQVYITGFLLLSFAMIHHIGDKYVCYYLGDKLEEEDEDKHK